MISYEIWVDGKKVCVAGHEQVIFLHASLVFPPGAEEPHLAVVGRVQAQPSLIEEHSWIGRSIQLGSEVLIKVVDSSKPDVATELRSSYGTRLHPTYKELFCSFCGRAEKDVRYLCEGIAGNICDECVVTCQETIQESMVPGEEEDNNQQ